MVDGRTVIVCGAGASKEFGNFMPVGSELAERIQDTLASELLADGIMPGPIIASLQQSKTWGTEARTALTRIRDGITLKDSIDDFVDEWSEFPMLADIAKLSIVHEIIRAEDQTQWGQVARGQQQPHHALRAMRNTWLGQILRRHNSRATPNRREFAAVTSDLAFITFNYDRCIEQHLLQHLIVGLNTPPIEAVEAVSAIPIIHVYGTAGKLQDFGGNQAYGHIAPELLWRSAQQIRTYTETVDSVIGDQVAQVIKSAKKIIFLGWAFHPQNLRLLFPNGMGGMDQNSAPQIWGTTLGMSNRRMTELHTEFANPYHAVVLQAESAGDLLNRYNDEIFG